MVIRVVKVRWALGTVVVVVALVARSLGPDKVDGDERFRSKRVAVVVDPRRETGS